MSHVTVGKSYHIPFGGLLGDLRPLPALKMLTSGPSLLDNCPVSNSTYLKLIGQANLQYSLDWVFVFVFVFWRSIYQPYRIQWIWGTWVAQMAGWLICLWLGSWSPGPGMEPHIWLPAPRGLLPTSTSPPAWTLCASLSLSLSLRWVYKILKKRKMNTMGLLWSWVGPRNIPCRAHRGFTLLYSFSHLCLSPSLFLDHTSTEHIPCGTYQVCARFGDTS